MKTFNDTNYNVVINDNLWSPIHPDETAALAESQYIPDRAPNEASVSRSFFRSIKTMLTRKYRIWPDHFWPRSWVRRYNKFQANRDFVRRARLASQNLEDVDVDDYDGPPKDSLF